MSSADFASTTFNTVVFGSDIVWDYSFEIFNHDPKLFGVGIQADKKVAYAATFGTIKRGSEYPQYVVDGVRSLTSSRFVIKTPPISSKTLPELVQRLSWIQLGYGISLLTRI